MTIVAEQMKTQHIKSELKDNVLYLTLDRPERSNAFNSGMYEQLLALLKDASTNQNVTIFKIVRCLP
jgi:enoyl-CoA hydratase/carnithine racemase